MGIGRSVATHPPLVVAVELRIPALQLQEFGVASLFDDPPLTHHEDPVGHRNRREPVRDEDRRPPGRELGKLVEEFGLGPDVDMGGRFVENQQRCLAGEGAGDRDPLLAGCG